MKTTLEMIKTHPLEPFMDAEKLASAIAEMYTCAQACTSCADACLGEKKVEWLAGCIRLNLDCADVCNATGAVLSRMTRPDTGLMKAMVQACAQACSACTAECDKHAEMHAHCRVCANACRSCEKACRDIMESIR
jgi:hypothetical protein